MNTDVAVAVEDLRSSGTLTEVQAVLPRRAARGEIVSLRGELGVLLYAGVLLVVAGAGLLVKQNLAAIGPIGIALGIGVAAIVALAWVVRTAPRFSWGAVPSPHLAFDYLLLLGLLLGAADLGYIEVQFTPLGAAWPWHLLIVALVTMVFAIRYDSRVALSLALSSFAAWRGVSVSFLEWNWWRAPEEIVRVNMIVCGAAFVGLGVLFVKSGRKAHFEPVATTLGWLLVLGALFTGMVGHGNAGDPGALSYAALLFVLAGYLAWRSLRRGLFPLFAIGVVGAYAGLCGLVLRGLGSSLDAIFWFAWFAISSLAVLAALVMGHAAMRRKP